MQIFFYFVIVLHVIVSLFLIGVVLLQQGRSADLAGAFGGQGSQTAFGPRAAANVLTRLTTWSAMIFMLTSLSLDDPLRSLRPFSFRPRRHEACIGPRQIRQVSRNAVPSAIPAKADHTVCLLFMHKPS